MALIEYRVVQRFLEIRISKGGIEFMGLLLKIKQIQFNSTLYHMNKFQIDFIEKKNCSSLWYLQSTDCST